METTTSYRVTKGVIFGLYWSKEPSDPIDMGGYQNYGPFLGYPKY